MGEVGAGSGFLGNSAITGWKCRKVAAVVARAQAVGFTLHVLSHLGHNVITARLLGLHRRPAIRLMHRLGGYQSGRTFLIETQKRALEEIASGEAFQYETARRERLGSALAESKRDFKARRILIPVTPEMRGREVAGLPATVRLAPGRLEISCRDAADLLQQLMELAQAVRNDYDGFEARFSPGSTA